MSLNWVKFETEFSLTAYLDYYIYSEKTKNKHKQTKTITIL